MQDALRQELMSPNPDTSLYRMGHVAGHANAEAVRGLDASPSGSMPGLRSPPPRQGLRPVRRPQRVALERRGRIGAAGGSAVRARPFQPHPRLQRGSRPPLLAPHRPAAARLPAARAPRRDPHASVNA